MKKSVLLAVFLLVAGFPAWAQVEKGTHAVGATVSLNRYEATSQGLNLSKSISFTPEYAYFFADNWSVLGGSSIGNRDRKVVSPSGQIFHRIEKTFRAFSGVRKHIPIQDQLFLIGTFGLEYLFDNDKSESIRETKRSVSHIKTHEFGIFGNLGLIYFPSNRWSLELIVLEADLHRIRTNALVDNEINNYFNSWALNLAGQMSSPSLAIRYYFLGDR